MSHNFYHRYNACDDCGRHDERHVGKWQTLQGYRRPDWLDDDQPFDEITTWAQWKVALRAGGELWDEYGRQWDVEEFIKDMGNSRPEDRRRQYDWMQEHYHADRDDWLDPEGFSFCGREFT